ncbi:MAG: hypothetical protein ACRERS_10985, partial [Methylococcales bacterium]
GTLRAVSNQASAGLVDPASGFGTPANPAPAIAPADAVAVAVFNRVRRYGGDMSSSGRGKILVKIG